MQGAKGMIRACALVLGLAFSAAPAVAQDAAKAQGIAAQVCAACHAADGNSIGPANPKLAGQFPEYLHKQLVDFKAQGGKKPARENPVMNGMVANLSAADMQNLAAYFSGQKLKPAAAQNGNRGSMPPSNPPIAGPKINPAPKAAPTFPNTAARRSTGVMSAT